jgi:catechol 2,3-dioxygenase-like lactoylglutathione lyase family enzyme
VTNAQRSIEFYRDGLGLEVVQDHVVSGPEVDESFKVTNGKLRFVCLKDSIGNMVELFDWQSPRPQDTGTDPSPFTRPGVVEVAIVVRDLEGAVQKLKEQGYSARSSVWDFARDESWFGNSYYRIQYVEDPDGVQLELMQLTPKGTDTRRLGERVESPEM